MIALNQNLPVGQLAAQHPQTGPVFEQWGIDYCCGGKRPLSQAIAESSLDRGAVIAALEEAIAETADEAIPWSGGTLSELLNHILDKHHQYMHGALPRIDELLRKVADAHGEKHGALLGMLREVFGALQAELESHLQKEEQVLFPYIFELDDCATKNGQRPAIGCGSAAPPIDQMEHEHDNAGAALERLRKLTDNYALPKDACASFAALYEELDRMDRDLHEHIHLENNILFPRTLELERELGLV